MLIYLQTFFLVILLCFKEIMAIFLGISFSSLNFQFSVVHINLWERGGINERSRMGVIKSIQACKTFLRRLTNVMKMDVVVVKKTKQY